MASSASPSAPRSRTWIVSPGWDLFYVVLTPVLIVPVVVMAARRWLQPEQVYLAVISFASLGHHLPGFMRAYGDRELFARFRLRFLLAPPLVFAAAILFTPPPAIGAALGLPWTHLHGLELILLIWGTWHGLMQTYGFMRIYDLRRGENDRTTARLDQALCVAIFVCGIVFSDVRMFGMAGAMWQAGLPLFGPEALADLRWVVGVASGGVAVCYGVHLLSRKRHSQPINGVKLLLAVTTGWFYWYCGRLSTNLLIGVAMFEIYHAVQYNAIVWIYNRRLLERARERFGPLGFLFRDRATMLCIYLAAIAAYSSIRYFTASSGDRMFSGDVASARQWLVALFVTSSILHFYYDGFIWKVSDRRTGENLVDDPIALTPWRQLVMPRLAHAGKWGVLAAITAVLFFAEQGSAASDPRHREAQQRALAELTPSVPEAKMLAAEQALARGDKTAAARLARQAAAARPDSPESRSELAWALLLAGQYAEAKSILEQTVAANPDGWEARCDLAETCDKLGETDRAEAEYRRAAELAPRESEPIERLVDLLIHHDRAGEAAPLLAELVRRKPDDVQLQIALGTALSDAGKAPEALAALNRAIELDGKSAEAQYQLGLEYLKQGAIGRAISPLRTAVKLNPKHFQAWLQLGDAFMALEKPDLAASAYRSAIKVDPKTSSARVCLASALLNTGQGAEAETVLRDGLAIEPDSAPLCYSLGLLLRGKGEVEEADALLDRAAKKGLNTKVQEKTESNKAATP